MKSLYSKVLIPLALCVAPLAQAQNCGTGGGATVCLTATGSGSDIRLNWTVNGAVSAFSVYRDTDATADGRGRLTVLGNSALSYSDTSATPGKAYWYWIKFTTASGSYSTSGAWAVRVGVMRNLTSMDLSKQMAPGWNLGNTLDAVGDTKNAPPMHGAAPISSSRPGATRKRPRPCSMPSRQPASRACASQ